MNKLIRLLMGSSLAVLALSACTKEIPYEEKLKEEVLTKFDTKSDYLMSSSMLNASRTSQDALPFSSGDNKRVRMEWGKTSLRIIEMEKDARFKGNDTNNKLVMEIPVEYVEYQCAKDKFGECTNTEEAADIPWEQKSKFKFKPEAAKSARLEILPILLDNELSGGFCYDEISSRVVGLKLEPDALNMSIERTFRLNAFCLMSNDLADTTVQAVFHYSFVKTSSVLTEGFKTVEYPKLDEGTFGFFTTESQSLDTDNNASVQGERTIMNHWNPDRKEITYYLSDEFKKPEHAKIRDLTFKVVESLNSGLAQSEAKFRINLKDGEGRNPGDIRNSMIVLVEDPVASSIIGYGPQTEDPVTGEIISAKTVMFLGTIKKFVKHTYDDIIREKKEQKLAKAKVEEEEQKKPDEDPKKDGDNGGLIIEDALKARIAGGMFKPVTMKSLATHKPAPSSSVAGTASIADHAKAKLIEKDVRNYTKSRNTDYEGGAQAHLKYLQEAKNCAYGLNADIMSTSLSPRLAQAFPDDAKPWEQLTSAEQQAVIDIILPEVWVPTLIHEMGHNLGLRHNFKGSEDPANFYTEQELASLNIDHAIPFSTVMEYGDDLKALPVLGKYDIAALRFAYGKKLELADGSLVPVQGTIKETLEKLNKEQADKEDKGEKAAVPVALKDYGFCTDEHTNINAGCRRFDIGVSLTEIVENEIKTYLAGYESRNKRAGRADMSLVEDVSYAARIRSRFQGMRLMQESYESIKTRFGIPEGHPIWESNAFLKDLKTSSALAGQFLMSVVATPDLTCAMVDISNPTQIADAVRLDELDASQISCFKVNMADFGRPNMVIVGQYGKLFQSRKDPLSDNSWADQIDVRGYWLDKLVATRVLFARDLGISTLDRETDNFTDRADLAPDIMGLTQAMLLNKIGGIQDLELANGAVIPMELPVDMKLEVEKPLFSGLAKALGIPNERVSFSKIFIDTISSRMVNETHKLSGNEFMDVIRVSKTHVGDKWSGDYKTMDISTERFLASPKNVLARSMIASHELSSKIDKVASKDANGRQRLIELYLARKGKEPQPKGLTKEERIVWNLGEEAMFDYLTGALEKPDFFEELMTILPN